MRRVLATASILLIGLVGIPPAAASPPVATRPILPPVTAEAWILYDVDAGVVLGSQNEFERRPMASVTKALTALVAAENSEPDDLVTISEGAASTGESEIGLVPGELWTMRELLTAIMVRSANDAAVAIAEHVGGSVEGFAEMMNAKAVQLGMADSHFTNPHGLDEDGHYSSAADLLTLGMAAIENPLITRLASTRAVVFRSDPQGRPRRAFNTNGLLGTYPGIIGLKTGFTNDAGRVLISFSERAGRTIGAVVMGSEDHFSDTRELLEFGFSTYGPYDRLLAGLAEPQGGGGEVPELLLPESDRARIASMPALAPGSTSTTPLEETGLGQRIARWVASQLPFALGGDE